MRYLAELVKALADEEIDAVLAQPVTGKERALLEWTWANRTHPGVNNVDYVRECVGVTENTLFKLNSILCDKIYNTVVPGGGEPLLWWLIKRMLIANLYHEIQQQEKKIGTLPQAQQVSFYRCCFEVVQRPPLRFFIEKKMRYYGKQLVKVAKDVEIELYVAAMMTATMIYYRSAGLLEKKTVGNPYRNLRKMEEQIKLSGKPCLRANYYLNRGFSLYYTDVEYKPELTFTWLEKSLELFKVPGHDFTDDEIFVSNCRIAESLYGLSKYAEALEQYKGIFMLYASHLPIMVETYHHTKFVQLCLINGEMEPAIEVLNRKFLPRIQQRHPTILTVGSISFAKYHLLNKEPEKALEYVTLAQDFNKKDLYIQYEIELRNLQNASFALSGDTEFALSLAKKNQRYLRSKGLTLENSNYGYFYQMLMCFIKGNGLNEDLKEKYRFYHGGYYAVYGKILEAVAAKYKIAVLVP